MDEGGVCARGMGGSLARFGSVADDLGVGGAVGDPIALVGGACEVSFERGFGGSGTRAG